MIIIGLIVGAILLGGISILKAIEEITVMRDEIHELKLALIGEEQKMDIEKVVL